MVDMDQDDRGYHIYGDNLHLFSFNKFLRSCEGSKQKLIYDINKYSFLIAEIFYKIWVKFRILEFITETKVWRHCLCVEILTVRTTPVQEDALNPIFVRVDNPLLETFQMKWMETLNTRPYRLLDTYSFITDGTIYLFHLYSLS